MITEKMLLSLVPISRASMYRLMRDGKFPIGTFIRPGLRLWFADEICSWQASVNEFNPHYGRGRPRSKSS
jgi:predicted DNA-binding transcriptional regulator AlpA